MEKKFEIIQKDAEERVLRQNDGNPEFLLYLDQRVMEKGETLDIVTDKIQFEEPTHVVFVDDEPGKNFGHRCHYLLYKAESGKFIRKVPAKFPYFMLSTPDTLKLVRTCKTIEGYKRKKKMRIPFELAKLSAYAKLAPLPLKFMIRGRRYAILYSGGSNGRHVNDLEFLYRTLVDVYGYDSNDIYVLNYDGTVNYNKMPWETGPSAGFAPDGSAWRMVVNGPGSRVGFQDVIDVLKGRIRPWDCLLVHTNNHGWYDSSGGFLSAYGPDYYASDFAADLAVLPTFKNLLVVMEQCASGSFAAPIMSNTPAKNTVFQAAVPGDESSAGGWPFDPWAEMWISAMAGVRGNGNPLAVSPDDDLNSMISAWEAYDYSLSIDSPVISESSPGLANNLYLCRCQTTFKPMKEHKEFKEFKEHKEFKEFKEPKEYLEHKKYEGPEIPWTEERYRDPFAEMDERMERLEQAVDKLTPFILSDERPQLKPKAKRKKENGS